MRYAIIQNNKVTNVVEAPSGWTNPDTTSTTVQSDTAQIGWAYDGKDVVAPAPVPPTTAQLMSYAESAHTKVLNAGQTFNVGTSDSPVNILCDGTTGTRASLSMLALFGQGNASGSKTWIDNNGVATVLTGSQLVTLTTLAGTWIADTYPALHTLMGDITASSPTVTTYAQIDSYAWPSV